MFLKKKRKFKKIKMIKNDLILLC